MIVNTLNANQIPNHKGDRIADGGLRVNGELVEAVEPEEKQVEHITVTDLDKRVTVNGTEPLDF